MKASAKRNFSPDQSQASDPSQNVWVQANAGTGKTSVLVQRLLRILFRSYQSPPYTLRLAPYAGILCLTYTNAGAGEMRNRILAQLRGWAMESDDEMRLLLRDIAHNKIPTDDDIKRARAIFYEYIDNPGMLKIRTIHGFCEEVLRRFPCEAGVPPAWKLISGADQKRLLKDVFSAMFRDGDTNSQPLIHVLDNLSEHSLDDLLDILLGQYRRFFKFNNRKQFIDTTKKYLEIGVHAQNAFFDAKNAESRQNIVAAIAAEKKPAGYLLKISEQIKKHFPSCVSRLAPCDFAEYKSAFLTADGAKNKIVAKKDYLAAEQDLVHELNQENINRDIFDNSVALFDLINAFAAKYRNTKLSRGLLDFDDLILYTNKLFADPAKMGWVLSQLDNNINHILLDEAQDTSPEQWEILQSMTTNFFTLGDDALPRSLFVVGDTKQSIFSFQGADPESFVAAKTNIGAQIQNDMRQIMEIPLSQSYRSTAPILSAIDHFFGDISISSLTKFRNNNHKIFRVGDPGLVELYQTRNPAESVDTSTARGEFIHEIAGKVENLVKTEQFAPSDIMILVQRRNPFAPLLIDELQKRGISVAGSDRIRLPDFPAVRDLINLGRWATDTSDDYMLACVLKSPLFRLSEADLFKLCHKRDGNLFEMVKKQHPKIFTALEPVVSLSKLPPYSFFMKVLGMNDNRARMIGALGTQIIDPLEEFLTICLSYERTQAGGLQKFIKWFVDGGSEIVREIDKNAGVRVVTTHGAKGLEAPVVFIIDTIKNPKTPGATRIAEPVGVPQNGNAFLWKGRLDKTDKFLLAESERHEKSLAEYYRLLYVAMTRARDRLYIFGFKGARDASENSWHEMLWKILPNHPNAKINQDGNVIIS